MSAPAAPAWRLLTLADLGARVGGTTWDVSDSGDPARPLRFAAASTDTTPCVWPIQVDGLVPLADWRMRAAWTNTSGTNRSIVGVGTFDGVSESTICVAGVSFELGAFSARNHAAANAAPNIGVGGLLTLPTGDALVRADTYGSGTGAVNRNRTASSLVVGEDLPGKSSIVSRSVTPAFAQVADVACVVLAAAAASISRHVDVAIYYLDPADNPLAG